MTYVNASALNLQNEHTDTDTTRSYLTDENDLVLRVFSALLELGVGCTVTLVCAMLCHEYEVLLAIK